MKETSKSIARRARQPDFITRIFVGQGLDIGGANDPLALYGEQFPGITGTKIWDVVDGDLQFLTGLADASFDFVHSAFVLQKMADPKEALRHWLRVLKPGGHMVVLVPDEDMYEQGWWPSRHNLEHRWTFTLFKTKSWSPVSVNLLEVLPSLGVQADIRRIESLDGSFRHRLPRFDQTLTPVGEAAIEFIIRKRPQPEAVAGGRFNAEAQLSPRDVFLLTGLRVETQKG
ncbi:SAM-dependent methyltransferase [Paramagnetospirillum magnetotacticum MS-1]|uniref:SAM-dependent methyltransferase n=1 Tax=Paramagnetospirillum magnetotacticum MS-1 TaxID=272627 RepID=A0A0C2YLJ9_PARME|nr:methyltransferase domain-containing protein [Paramagnetospirillum magnetotacticum]KIM00665.1 SAM-dependent methyltransferase [Paramagnetospirillum magnetotacticum MS-1]